MSDNGSPFVRLYEDPNSAWGGSSGPGSEAYFTIEYRAFLEKFMAMNRVTNVIDIGCGDWAFSRHINFSGVAYRGFDVVSTVIESNRQRYERNGISFEMMPDRWADLPDAQLVVIKDVLQHLPDNQIFEFRDQVCRRYPLVLITNSFEKLETPRNVNIKPGEFRCLDLLQTPYNFGGAYVLEFGSGVWERIRTLLCTAGPG